MSQNYNYLYGVDEPRTLLRDFTIGFVSGALVSGIKNSARDGVANEKIKDGLKTAVQSGVAASVISRSNRQMLCGHYADAMLSLAIGATGVYMIEKINETKKQHLKEEVAK